MSEGDRGLSEVREADLYRRQRPSSLLEMRVEQGRAEDTTAAA